MTFLANSLGTTSTFAPSVSSVNNEVIKSATLAQAYLQQARLGNNSQLAYSPPPAVASFTSLPSTVAPISLFGSVSTSPNPLFLNSQASSSGGGGTFSGGQGGQGRQQQGFTG